MSALRAEKLLHVHVHVHAGFYFISLALTARKGEPLFALDLFGQQSKNLDKSGNGDRNIFLHNVAAVGIKPETVVIHEGLSTDLSDAQMCQKVGARFRFLSIDGGHTKDIGKQPHACMLPDAAVT